MTIGNYPPGGTWEIDNGWDVITSDGEKLGDVEEVHPHYLVVGKGLIFHSERYVPVSTITEVIDDKVHIGVTKDGVDRLGWETIPDFTDTTPAYDETLDTTRTTDQEEDIVIPVRGEEVEERDETATGSVRREDVIVEGADTIEGSDRPSATRQ